MLTERRSVDRRDRRTPDFRRLFESVPGLYLILTPDLRIVAASDAFLRATMTRRDDIVGRGLFEVFPDNPADEHATGTRNLRSSLDYVRESRTTDVLAVQKYDIRRPEAEGGGFEERYWSPVNSPVIDEDGELAYIIHRVEDVTDFIRLKRHDSEHARRTEALQDQAHKMEAEIFQRAQQLQAVNRQLRAANAELAQRDAERTHLYDQLRRLDEVKTKFFANVSHELRTPLTLILGHIEQLLAHGESLPNWRTRLTVVQRNARTLLRQVNDLLDVARLEAGKLQIQHAEVDVARLVREAAANFDALAQQSRISYEVHTPSELIAHVDPEKLSRVLVNLLANAFKFTPAGGRVICELGAHVGAGLDTIHIKVADSGPGIPLGQRDAIFDRFYQAGDKTARHFEGTGLGLAIVRDLVDLHGGTVRVGDAPAGGAEFRVELPRLAPATVSVASRSTSAARTFDHEAAMPADDGSSVLSEIAAEVTPSEISDRPTILVVEDNVDMSRFLVDGLRTQFRVVTAASGYAALDVIGSHAPDLIVTDLMMPGMSGLDLLKAVRSRPDAVNIPVLVLTARAEDELRLDLLRAGAQDYLIKPFAMEELLARITNLLIAKNSRESLQRALATTEDNLATLAQAHIARQHELELARAEAESANRMKDEFLAMVSHELRSPLTPILGWATLLRRSDLNRNDAVKALEAIERNARIQKNMVEDLLDLTGIVAGNFPLRMEPVQLSSVVEHAVAGIRAAAQSKSIHLTTAVLTPRPVVGDERRLEQVVQNLLLNAVKFTPPGGSVRTEISEDGSDTVLSVSDSGEGLMPDSAGHVFEPFWQEEIPLNREHGGIGLGLAIVRHIVRCHGGSIEAKSEGKGMGSTFIVRLPAERSSD